MPRVALLGLVLAVLAVLAGCRSAEPGAGIPHDDPGLALHEGERSRLRTDLPAAEAEEVLGRLDVLEVMLDTTFPFLDPPAEPPLTLALADAARFALHAEEHGLAEPPGAFVCAQGEVYLRYRPEAWPEGPVGPPFPLEPSVRPLAGAVVRRRLLKALGPDLAPSWLEDGMALVFAELAAHELGQGELALREARERLIDAYLPLFLGEPPALTRLVEVEGEAAKAQTGSRALAWAAVRFLLADAERTGVLALALRRLAGEEVGAAEREEALAFVAEEEAAFEAFLRDAVLRELLAAFVQEGAQVDRWESAAALRLFANVDLDPDQDAETRRLMADATAEHFAAEPPPTRFLAGFAAEIASVRGAPDRLRASARLERRIAGELQRRSAGYGHPAIERAKRGLRGAIRRALLAGGE